MWVVREIVRLIVRITACIAVALGLAALLAAVSPYGFTADARVLSIAIGCVLLAMAGVGSGSNIDRYMDMNVTKVAWGSIPGFDALKRSPEDPTIAPGAALFSSGLAVIAVGVLI